ncbi:Chloride conductance regulatory protein ICln [Diplonema papillatum]|nr:Chloride conductance regulatory protein ICln [Diplonema papillatum]
MYFGKVKAGTGTLYITSKQCLWFNDEAAQGGYSTEWPGFMMHAVCTDATAFHCPHIYCMLDRELQEEAEEGKETPDTTNDIRFAPIEHEETRSLLDKLFHVFSEAASMAPDEVFTGEVGHVGDFNPKKRKFDETSSENFEPLSLGMFGEPGSALTPEEMEEKLAEWDSKIIVEPSFQPKGVSR